MNKKQEKYYNLVILALTQAFTANVKAKVLCNSKSYYAQKERCIIVAIKLIKKYRLPLKHGYATDYNMTYNDHIIYFSQGEKQVSFHADCRLGANHRYNGQRIGVPNETFPLTLISTTVDK